MRIFFVLFLSTVTAIFADPFCFEHAQGKTISRMTFNSDYNVISGGVYRVTTNGKVQRTARFHGTKSGTVYLITFTGKMPYKKPQGDGSVVWTRNGNTLHVPMAGRNKKTKKNAEYDAVFHACKR